MNQLLSSLILVMVAFPVAQFLVLIFLYIFRLRESLKSSFLNISSFLHFILALIVSIYSFDLGILEFSMDIVHFDIFSRFEFYLNQPGLILVCSFLGLGFLVTSFATKYLLNDQYNYKFYLLYPLFIFSILLIFASNNLLINYTGWELLGLTSIFLISYFHNRVQPVESALKVLLIYKVGDIFFLSALLFMFEGNLGSLHAENLQSMPEIVKVLFVLSLFVKSAVFPFTYWLPRSVEGPTPTSAVYYGGIAVHVGIGFFLLNFDFLKLSTNSIIVVVAASLISLIISLLQVRIASDAKVVVAYASAVQISFMFILVSLGFKWAPLWLIVGNLFLRTYQMLKAPSALLNFEMHQSLIDNLRMLNWQNKIYSIFPKRIRYLIYRLSLDEWGMRNLWDILIFKPGRDLQFLIRKSTGLNIVRKFVRKNSLIGALLLLSYEFAVHFFAIPNSPDYVIYVVLFFMILLALEGIHESDPSMVAIVLLTGVVLKGLIVFNYLGVNHETLELIDLSMFVTVLFAITLLKLSRGYKIRSLSQYHGLLGTSKLRVPLLIFLGIAMSNGPFLLLAHENEEMLLHMAIGHHVFAALAIVFFDNLIAYLVLKTTFRVSFGPR